MNGIASGSSLQGMAASGDVSQDAVAEGEGCSLEHIYSIIEKNVHWVPVECLRHDSKRANQLALEYFIEEVYEAGMVLLGPEVKSLRDGRASLADSYARIKKGEVFLHNMHISPYPFTRHVEIDPTRTRKLLLNKNLTILSWIYPLVQLVLL